MRKFVNILLLLFNLFLVFSLFSCKDDVSEGEYITFKDSLGKTVALDERPTRVAVLFSSFADMWLTAGGEIAITVGESVERGFASEEVLLVDTGAGKHISLELLISYKPDFVIYSADIDGQLEVAKTIEAAGISAAGFRVNDFSDYLSVFDIMTDITGNKQAYADYGIDIEKKIASLISTIEGKEEKKILFIRASTSEKSTKAKVASQHFVASMLKELGSYNIAEEAPILLDGLSIEAVIEQNPDIIFISAMGDEGAVREYMDSVLKSTAWQSLDAVKNGRYYYLSKDIFQFKPNARWYEAYHTLAEILYGKEF